jgi:hypothetical protein
MESNMEELNNVVYHPCVRAGKYDLLALKEIEEDRRKTISPIISARGSDLKDICTFAEQWGDNYFWFDSSRFPQDIQNPLSSLLNEDTNNFSSKLKALKDLQAINPKTLPVIGFRSGDSQRNVVQLGLKLLLAFPIVAIRVEGSGAVLDKNLATARALLNAISDDDLNRTALIVDAWSISQLPSLQEESSIRKILTLTNEYPIKNVITLSTSWPDDRPDRGANVSIPCIDPIWQAVVQSQLAAAGIKSSYGDYAATNPMRDILDEYDPAKMAQPIPFAGYYSSCSWYQERRGAGGENEKYREIAQAFRQLPTYHEDDFCWGTKAIAAIATGAREKSGNMAFWNKIRVNQHICAMANDVANGLLTILNQPPKPLPDNEDDDLI